MLRRLLLEGLLLLLLLGWHLLQRLLLKRLLLKGLLLLLRRRLLKWLLLGWLLLLGLALLRLKLLLLRLRWRVGALLLLLPLAEALLLLLDCLSRFLRRHDRLIGVGRSSLELGLHAAAAATTRLPSRRLLLLLLRLGGLSLDLLLLLRRRIGGRLLLLLLTEPLLLLLNLLAHLRRWHNRLARIGIQWPGLELRRHLSTVALGLPSHGLLLELLLLAGIRLHLRLRRLLAGMHHHVRRHLGAWRSKLRLAGVHLLREHHGRLGTRSLLQPARRVRGRSTCRAGLFGAVAFKQSSEPALFFLRCLERLGWLRLLVRVRHLSGLHHVRGHRLLLHPRRRVHAGLWGKVLLREHSRLGSLWGGHSLGCCRRGKHHGGLRRCGPRGSWMRW